MRPKSPEREKARKLYLKSNKTANSKEIAEKLGVSVLYGTGVISKASVVLPRVSFMLCLMKSDI